MKKGTNSSMKKRKAAIKRRRNRLKFVHKELADEVAAKHGGNSNVDRISQLPDNMIMDNNIVDRISQLPDDILISIISRLTLREATATSILSSRWQHLCTYTTRLDFPPFKPSCKFNDEYLQEIQRERFPSYINSINRTLESYKGSRLKEFKVHMHCLKGANIERWLEFALARKVEIFHLHMTYLLNARHGNYPLQLENFLFGKNCEQLSRGLKCLKELSLSIVHVNDREVELLLANFPMLESLSITFSEELRNLLIVGNSGEIKLKHLDVSHSRNLECIEIRDMINLVSFKCYRFHFRPTIIRLSNVPKLIELCSSDCPDNTLAEVLLDIPSCVHDQLLLLKLSTDPAGIRTYSATYRVPDLINVKHLEVECRMSSTIFAPGPLLHLLEACLSLEKLDIKFFWLFEKFKDRKIHEYLPVKKLSPNLKKLKLSGYLGCPSEREFILYIIKNAVALEEFIIEPCDNDKKIRRQATARARMHFLPIIPKPVNVVIIG